MTLQILVIACFRSIKVSSALWTEQLKEFYNIAQVMIGNVFMKANVQISIVFHYILPLCTNPVQALTTSDTPKQLCKFMNHGPGSVFVIASTMLSMVAIWPTRISP